MRKIHSRSVRKYNETVRSQARIELRLFDALTKGGYQFSGNKTLAEILVYDATAYGIIIRLGAAKLVNRLMEYHERRKEAVQNGITPANELAKSAGDKTRPAPASRTNSLQIALPFSSDRREGWWELQQALHTA